MTNPFQVVRDFEAALAEYTGAPYAVSTTSCTMALLLAVAWHLRDSPHQWQTRPANSADLGRQDVSWVNSRNIAFRVQPEIEIPKRTYVGVPMSIINAGGRPSFRDEDWTGVYQLKPLPVWDSARWFTSGMYTGAPRRVFGDMWLYGTQGDLVQNFSQSMICVSFHWNKTLGIQQGGAILHDSPEADAWLRRARFDGREEGVAPAEQREWQLGWHAYMSPETAAAGLVRLASLPKNNDPLPWGPGTSSDYPDLSTLEIFR